MIHSFADGKIEDTGALTKKRMETIDDETTAAAQAFIEKQAKADKPFFVWMNTTRMHVFTHVRESMAGQSGMPGNEYADGMVEHDNDVGKLLKTLDDLKIADNTIVVYTTDNGPNQFSWPDAATTPFRNEKNSNWEGAYRVPAMVRWPGKVKAGEVSNEMFSGLDWFPTLLAAAGESGVKDKLLKGWAPTTGGASFKVHLDGFNQLPYLTGQQPKGERHEFYYFNDDGVLVSMRFDNWKVVFCEQRQPGGFRVWSEPFVCLRVPKILNLRMDPYERADVVSDQFYDWNTKNVYLAGVAVTKSAKFLETFIEYPPSQKPASFSIDQIRAAVDAKIAEKMKLNRPNDPTPPGPPGGLSPHTAGVGLPTKRPASPASSSPTPSLASQLLRAVRIFPVGVGLPTKTSASLVLRLSPHSPGLRHLPIRRAFRFLHKAMEHEFSPLAATPCQPQPRYPRAVVSGTAVICLRRCGADLPGAVDQATVPGGGGRGLCHHHWYQRLLRRAGPGRLAVRPPGRPGGPIPGACTRCWNCWWR